MLLKFYEDKRCVSAIDLLLVRNLYELGYPEPDPNVSVSFTPQQREAASSLLIFHRRKQTGAEWKSFQYAVLNGRNRTSKAAACRIHQATWPRTPQERGRWPISILREVEAALQQEEMPPQPGPLPNAVSRC